MKDDVKQTEVFPFSAPTGTLKENETATPSKSDNNSFNDYDCAQDTSDVKNNVDDLSNQNFF